MAHVGSQANVMKVSLENFGEGFNGFGGRKPEFFSKGMFRVTILHYV